jgi:hypothetical protein
LSKSNQIAKFPNLNQTIQPPRGDNISRKTQLEIVSPNKLPHRLWREKGGKEREETTSNNAPTWTTLTREQPGAINYHTGSHNTLNNQPSEQSSKSIQNYGIIWLETTPTKWKGDAETDLVTSPPTRAKWWIKGWVWTRLGDTARAALLSFSLVKLLEVIYI